MFVRNWWVIPKPVTFNTLSTQLLKEQMVFFDKIVSLVLLFYNYSSILYLPNHVVELLYTLICLHKLQ